jgi:hypothetical protein
MGMWRPAADLGNWNVKIATQKINGHNRRAGVPGGGDLGYGVVLTKEGEYVCFVPRHGAAHYSRVFVGGPFESLKQARNFMRAFLNPAPPEQSTSHLDGYGLPCVCTKYGAVS